MPVSPLQLEPPKRSLTFRELFIPGRAGQILQCDVPAILLTILQHNLGILRPGPSLLDRGGVWPESQRASIFTLLCLVVRRQLASLNNLKITNSPRTSAQQRFDDFNVKFVNRPHSNSHRHRGTPGLLQQRGASQTWHQVPASGFRWCFNRVNDTPLCNFSDLDYIRRRLLLHTVVFFCWHLWQPSGLQTATTPSQPIPRPPHRTY